MHLLTCLALPAQRVLLPAHPQVAPMLPERLPLLDPARDAEHTVKAATLLLRQPLYHKLLHLAHPLLHAVAAEAGA